MQPLFIRVKNRCRRDLGQTIQDNEQTIDFLPEHLIRFESLQAKHVLQFLTPRST